MCVLSSIVISCFAIVILSVIGALFKANHHSMMGSKKDPEDGNVAAGTVFSAVIVYAVGSFHSSCEIWRMRWRMGPRWEERCHGGEQQCGIHNWNGAGNQILNDDCWELTSLKISRCWDMYHRQWESVDLDEKWFTDRQHHRSS